MASTIYRDTSNAKRIKVVIGRVLLVDLQVDDIEQLVLALQSDGLALG